jgi:hypothetical protein
MIELVGSRQAAGYERLRLTTSDYPALSPLALAPHYCPLLLPTATATATATAHCHCIPTYSSIPSNIILC